MSEQTGTVQVKYGNIIQIKRGNGFPPKDTLQEGELGYDKENQYLYIGNSEKEAVGIIGTSLGDSNTPVYIGENGIPVICNSFVPSSGGKFTGAIGGEQGELWGSEFPKNNLFDGRIFFYINEDPNKVENVLE